MRIQTNAETDGRLRAEAHRQERRAGPLVSSILDEALLPPRDYIDLARAADFLCVNSRAIGHLPEKEKAGVLLLARYVKRMSKAAGGMRT